MNQQSWILTAFSKALSEEALSEVNNVVALESASVPKTSRLSKRASDIFFKSDIASPKDFLKKFQNLREELAVDLVLQEDNNARANYKLAVFDMDSTLIKAEVIDELAKRAGVGERVAKVTEAAMRGELDFNQSLMQRLALIEGLSASVLDEIAANLPLMDGLPELMQGLKKRGIKTAILSGGFTHFALELQRRFGFDYVRSNELEIVDGKLTGKLLSEIVNAERKKHFLEEFCKKEGISLSQSIAVGDGANDLLMLCTAGLGIAFHAKPIVREKAPHEITTIGLDAILYILGLNS